MILHGLLLITLATPAASADGQRGVRVLHVDSRGVTLEVEFGPPTVRPLPDSPGYATLSPDTKAKLAALPKGELMVRHPHFTQPLFVRFPRPAVLPGRIGVERFPPAPELPFGQAVARQLRALDPALSFAKVEPLLDGRREEDVRRALHATRRTRPENVLAFFTAQLGKRVEREVAPARGVPGLRKSSDPYA